MKKNTLTKVISGGQTGADRAALEAAYSIGFKTGGLAPPDYMTADGKCPELGTKFGLNTRKAKKGNARYYIARSMMNVDLSDGTIAFRFKSSAGTDKTIGYCYSNKWTAEYDPKKKSKYKPVLIISTFDNQAKNIRQIIDFIDEHRIEILNVCGHRNYIHDKKSFQEQVQYLLTNAFDVYDMRNLE